MPAAGSCAMADLPQRSASALWLVGLIFSFLGGLYAVLGVVFLLVREEALFLLGVIFSGIGLTFLTLGVLFLWLEHRKRGKAGKLMESGRFVWGNITDWRENPCVTVGRRHPVTLMVRYVDIRGREYLFSSPSLWLTPGPRLLGRLVRVYYGDPDFKNYYVAVDSKVLSGESRAEI